MASDKRLHTADEIMTPPTPLEGLPGRIERARKGFRDLSICVRIHKEKYIRVRCGYMPPINASQSMEDDVQIMPSSAVAEAVVKIGHRDLREVEEEAIGTCLDRLGL